MNTLPISVVILAREIDPRLKAAIASVQWAAEILVMWSGVEEINQDSGLDGTVVVFLGDQISDFAEARNKALNEAAHDWIFFLDSDEVFDEKGLPELQKVIENPLIEGATVHRHDVFLQKEMKHGEVSAVSILRIVRKQKAKFERAVHEVAVVKGQVARTRITLYHFSHRSIEDFLAKVVLYVQLEKLERAKINQKFRLSEMLVFPPAKFIQNYFFRLGFLDGWRGLIYATLMSIHSFGVRASLYESHTK